MNTHFPASVCHTSFARKRRLTAALLLALSCTAAAQDLRTLQPPPVTPPKAPVPEAVQEAQGVPVRGFVLLDDLAAVRPSVEAYDGVNVEHVDDPRQGGLARAVLLPYIGQPITSSLIESLRSDLSTAFVTMGDRFTRIVLPAQEVRDGTIQIVLLRGRAGKVDVTGTRFTSPEELLGQIRLVPGEPMDSARLDEDIAWLNRNPFRKARAVTRAGAESGEVDVTVAANEARPWQFNLNLNNNGNASTGEEQMGVGVSWGDAFGAGHQLSYQHVESLDWGRLRSNSMTWLVPLRSRRFFSLDASTARIHSALPAPLDQAGKSSQVGLGYEIPLRTVGALTDGFNLRLEYKRSNSNLQFAQIPVFDANTAILQGSIAYSANRQDSRGSTSYGVAIVFSPGGTVGFNTDADFSAQRFGARSRYAYATADITRNQRVGSGSWLVSLHAQKASGNLLGSEQLSLGGAQSLRGYEEGHVYADEGLVLRNELRPPAYNGHNQQFQPLVFVDYGLGIVRNPLPGERKTFHLASAGLGMRYAFGRHFSLSLDYGMQLRDPDLGPRKRTSRASISASLVW